MTSTLPTPSPACLSSHCCTTLGLFQVSNHELQIRTSPSERKKIKQGVRGRRNKKSCLWTCLSTGSRGGLTALQPVHWKCRRRNHLPKGRDSEILFNSKRNGKKPRSSLHSLTLEKKKLKLWKSQRSFSEDSPDRKAGLRLSRLLKGRRCWGKGWEMQQLKKPQCSCKSIKISVACSRLEKKIPLQHF